MLPDIENTNNASSSLQNTGAVIVTYYPVIESLYLLIESISKTCSYCVVIDNTPVENNNELLQLENRFSNLKVICLQSNAGVARAQNIGINYLYNRCSFFIFFDQDSVPSKGMIEHLYTQFNELVIKGYRPGAIGPQIINKASGTPYVARIKKGTYLPGKTKLKEMSQLMSSGTFLSRESWQTIGLLEEQLFIDGVDMEWCWRGRKKNGLRFFVSEEVFLYHSIGEDRKLLGLFRIKAPTAERCYYLYRNYLYLIRRSYVPFYWKFSSGIKYILKLLLFPLLLHPRKKYLFNILRGIRAGCSTAIDIK